MADSNKEDARDEDDHHRLFDYTDLKKEEATTGYLCDEEDGHDDDDYTESKKEEGHEERDDRPFDYSFLVLARVADTFLRNCFPEGYSCTREERSPPLQQAASSRRSFALTATMIPVGTPNCTDVGATQRVKAVVFIPSGEGTSTNPRLQRDHSAAGAHSAEGRHQHPPAPAVPQAGRTWREVHRAMGGGEVVRIGKKTVHKSDTCMHQSRLLLNQGLEAQVYEHVLERERNEINSSRGMQVEVLNYCGERFQMICRYRASQKGMVFNSGWSKFLKEGESLLLLAFRTQQQRLCFVFVPQHLKDKINL